MKFQKNDRIETLKSAGVWVFLFGPLYFAKWDLWRSAVFVFVLALATGGLSWIVAPLFAGRLAAWEYDRKGWKKID